MQYDFNEFVLLMWNLWKWQWGPNRVDQTYGQRQITLRAQVARDENLATNQAGTEAYGFSPI